MPTATAMAMELPLSVYVGSTLTAVATPVPMSVHDLEDPVAMEALAHKMAAVFKLLAD
jgi:hypothetical protein